MIKTEIAVPILSQEIQSFLEGYSALQASMAHLTVAEQRRKIKTISHSQRSAGNR
jgi:hypothetical protein